MFEKIKKFFKDNRYFLLGLVITFLIINIKLPYYILSPGGTIDISDRIENRKINGRLNLLYASSFNATIPTYLLAKFNATWDIYNNEERIVSNESIKESEVRDKILLNNSLSNAIYVAYHEYGQDLKIKDAKIYVIGIVPKSECELKIGDEILMVNHQNALQVDIRNLIRNSNVEELIHFEVLRDKKRLKVDCPVLNINKEKVVGILYAQNNEYETDLNIKFRESESGSSGGMMLTLSIYASLSKDDIVKGRNIAGTGTIDLDGNVGEIGGIKYKIMGAHNNDVDIVFVPEENYKEALSVKEKYNYDLKIVKVKYFKEVIAYLKNN